MGRCPGSLGHEDLRWAADPILGGNRSVADRGCDLLPLKANGDALAGRVPQPELIRTRPVGLDVRGEMNVRLDSVRAHPVERIGDRQLRSVGSELKSAGMPRGSRKPAVSVVLELENVGPLRATASPGSGQIVAVGRALPAKG